MFENAYTENIVFDTKQISDLFSQIEVSIIVKTLSFFLFAFHNFLFE